MGVQVGREEGPARVLFLASNPTAMTFDFAEELHRIEAARRSRPGSFVVVPRWSVSLAELTRHVAADRPAVVHVLSPTVDPARNELVLSDETGEPEYVPSAKFAKAFAGAAGRATRLVVVNTCHSRRLAEDVARHVGCAIAMEAEIYDHAAVEFSDGLYRALAAGASVAEAFDAGCDAVGRVEPAQRNVPVLLAGREDPNSVRIAPQPETGAGVATVTAGQVLGHPPRTPDGAGRAAAPRCLQIFCSYSHKDAKYRAELEAHMANLLSQGTVKVWHDRLIRPGTDWARDIDRNLEQANIVMLLVSADFMASRYCTGVELARALERQAADGIRVVPILVRDCDLADAPFAQLQWLPTGAKPVKRWTDRDTAWTDVVKGLRKVVDDLSAAPARA
jgi:hypothetical protein